MRGFYSGLIAGIIAGVGATLWRIIESLLQLPTAIAGMLTVETIVYHLGYEIGQIGITGALFGILYARFYVASPSKRVKKGFIFGLIAFLISNVLWAISFLLLGLMTWIEEYFWFSLLWFQIGASYWILYGVMLGIIYERWK